MTSKQPTSPQPLVTPKPEFPVGTLVEILNNADRISLEDRMGIVREYFLKDTLTDYPYIAYHVELVTKPGVFRLRTKQFLKAANMPTKQPVPPPKFNIRDFVLFENHLYKVTDRNYIAGTWVYKLELVGTDITFLPNGQKPEVKESALKRHNFPQETKPMPDPEPGYRLLSKDPPEDLQPGDEWWEHDEQRWQGVSNPYNINQHKTTYYRRKIKTPQKIKPNLMYCTLSGPTQPAFVAGDLVLFKNCGREIQTGFYDHKNSEWLYKISVYPGGPEYDSPIRESELEPYNNPPTPQKSTTVVNEQGGKQSHLDARFDCIPPVVLRLLAQCLGFGARKYGDENWKNIPQRDNLNHAMNHINEWNRGNRDEPHLVNAMARLTFALWQAVDNESQPDTYIHPDDHESPTTT